ncbi:MAG: acyltransferase [Massilia sp.]|nr:acyltransferase [Massilia sp.]
MSWLITPLVSDVGFAGVTADAPAALVYLSNWWQIFSSQPYFEAAEAPRMLKHLWSLAVEEQFYIAWPPLAYFFLKKFGKQTTGLIALMLALLSTGWMWYRYDDGDPNRVYLGTDTHAMGLLLGAALACF